jgi:glycerophosphoryl diester phosphodiesterase
VPKLRRVIGLLAATLTLLSVTAQSASSITILGHRGSTRLDIPENTKMAFEYAKHADMLETDVRWTYDPVGGDPVMVLSHDSTMTRVFNCSYVISSTLWSTLRDKCRTRIASQRMMTLNELVAFANQTGQDLNLEIKQGNISDWKARQFYDAVKDLNGHVMVTAFAEANGVFDPYSTTLNSLKKVKALDAADTGHKLRYGLEASAYLPTISQVNVAGWNLCINKSKITAPQVANFQAAGIHVYLWIGYTHDDYAAMVAKNPNGVIVDDPEDFYQWLNG